MVPGEGGSGKSQGLAVAVLRCGAFEFKIQYVSTWERLLRVRQPTVLFALEFVRQFSRRTSRGSSSQLLMPCQVTVEHTARMPNAQERTGGKRYF